MTSPAIKPRTRAEKIKYRMEEFNETKHEAEQMIDWIDAEFNEYDMRKVLHNMIRNGDLL